MLRPRLGSDLFCVLAVLLALVIAVIAMVDFLRIY